MAKERKKQQSAFRLVPCKPGFHYAIHAVTGLDFSQTNHKVQFTVPR